MGPLSSEMDHLSSICVNFLRGHGGVGGGVEVERYALENSLHSKSRFMQNCLF